MFYRLFALTVMTVLFAGCASVPTESKEKAQQLQAFSPPAQGHAGIYVYRDSSFGASLKKDLWIDGKCLGRSAKDVFFYQPVVGNQEHDIATESEFSPNHLKVFTETGKNYFIRQYIKMGVISGGANLEVIDEAKGKKAVAKLDLAVAGVCKQTSPEK